MIVTWSIFKAFVDARLLSIQYVDLGDAYYCLAVDGPMQFECNVNKDGDTPQTQFEATYKALGNASFSDADGTDIYRIKIAKKGAKACLENFELETSQLNSLYSKKADLTDTNFCTIKFYDVSNVELTTQETIDSSCVKTVVDFEPVNINYEVIGGRGTILNTPNEDVRLWVVGVPDVPAAYGGSVEFLRGINMRYASNREFAHDGRVPKFMSYSATYHTSKFRFIIRHGAGSKHKFMINMELFYP